MKRLQDTVFAQKLYKETFSISLDHHWDNWLHREDSYGGCEDIVEQALNSANHAVSVFVDRFGVSYTERWFEIYEQCLAHTGNRDLLARAFANVFTEQDFEVEWREAYGGMLEEE